MTKEKLISAARACRSRIEHAQGPEIGPPRRDVNAEPNTHAGNQHLVFMCEEIECMVEDETKREKTMRWLGFVQGALWQADYVSIEELKELNRPDVEGPK